MESINKKLLETINDKKAIIWDFDGVLCFLDWSYRKDINKLRLKLWQVLEEFDPNIRGKFNKISKYSYEYTDYIVKRHGQKALEKINPLYVEIESLILSTSIINDPLIYLIKNLDPDIEHYIWSNNQGLSISKILKKTDILDMFKTVVSRDRVTLAKPDIGGYKIIQSLTNILKKDFLFVGDSENTDEIVARKLNIDFFLYRL